MRGRGYKFRKYRFWTPQKFRFPTVIILQVFETGCKNSLRCLEKKYGNIGWGFCSSLEFCCKFDNNRECLLMDESQMFSHHCSKLFGV